jgi:hypothetical protein
VEDLGWRTASCGGPASASAHSPPRGTAGTQTGPADSPAHQTYRVKEAWDQISIKIRGPRGHRQVQRIVLHTKHIGLKHGPNIYKDQGTAGTQTGPADSPAHTKHRGLKKHGTRYLYSGIPDPNPEPGSNGSTCFRIRILLSSSKNRKKTLIPTVL